MIRHKLIRGETKVLDVKAGRVEAVVSTEDKDRQGDIIRQEGWDLAAFMKHPILLSSHDYFDLRSQIGEWEAMKVSGTKLVGTARYYVGEGNEQADWGFNLASKGRAAFSVGFIPDMDKAKPLEKDEDEWMTHYEFNGQELLEVSHVTIPANANALQAVRGVKGLHPAIAEIVDETLRDMNTPASITLSGTFDGQTEDLLNALAQRIAASLRSGGVGLAPPPPSSGAVAPVQPDGGSPKTFDPALVGEAVDLALKEYLLA